MIKILSLIVLLVGSIGAQITGPECLSPCCYCLNAVTLYCANFTQFPQLDFRRTNGRVFHKVDIIPLSFIDLNENLNLNGLKLNGKLSFSNIRSINPFYNPFRVIQHERFDLAFYNSNFRFVNSLNPNNEENLILQDCEINQNSKNLDFIFSNLELTEFILCNVFFEKPTCPVLFRNSIIKNIIITDPIGAFGFSKIKQDPIIFDTQGFLNSFISQLELSFSPENTHPQYIDTENILNPNLFVYLERLNIISAKRLAYIQEDTFKNLPSLKKLELNNVPLKTLLTYNRRWMKNMNYREKFYDIDYIRLNSSISNNIFQFIVWVNDDWNFVQEKDVCLFKNFPHNKLVFPFLLFSKPDLPCTCTIYWLYKYFSKYQDIYNLNQNIAPYHCFRESNWDKCQFNDLFMKYCPGNEDPEESFTTLRPSTGTVSYLTNTFTPLTLTQTSDFFTSSYFQNVYDRVKDCRYSKAALIIAIILCVVAFLIIIVLAILYYKVSDYKEEKRIREANNTHTINSNQSEVQI
ncbi:unnamed protein product [Brachionus calyciflorus]|uniref:Uncharacterized protein n=1 Tax=Brachionus calyciflorus TaxID=104777 RepID=A0A814H2D4_9BILA|nr:unnamed protein product [Brachionus calyciflorus]